MGGAGGVGGFGCGCGGCTLRRRKRQECNHLRQPEQGRIVSERHIQDPNSRSVFCCVCVCFFFFFYRVENKDFGVKRPRSIDGPIPFKIAGKVAVEDWTGRKDNIAEEMIFKRSKPVLLRNTVVKRWPALAKWTPEYFRTSVPSWRNTSRAKALKRCFINFEPNTPLERVTPWEFWENKESREEYPMPMSEWFEKASVKKEIESEKFVC